MNHTLLVLCALVATIWTLWAFLARRALLHTTRLSPPKTTDRHNQQTVRIVVPARNEAETLEAGLRSLSAQRGIDFEIVVVNDHSDDATGRIADRIAHEDSRIRVIHNPELPPGWLGKTNAMHQAAEDADTDFLLFTDADIVHAPDCLRAALEAMRAGGAYGKPYDFLSLGPRTEWVTLWENALAALFWMGLPLFSTGRLENPNAPEAAGIGAFLLVRTDPYRAIGGHEALKAAVVDDVLLARKMKQAGHLVGVRLAPDLLHCRMHRNNKDAFWGLAKNALDAVEGHRWLPFAMLPLLLALFWTSTVCMLVGLVTLSVPLVLAGGALHLTQYAAFYPAREIIGFDPVRMLCFPLGAVSLSACLLRALYYRVFHKSVMWRDRKIQC